MSKFDVLKDHYMIWDSILKALTVQNIIEFPDFDLLKSEVTINNSLEMYESYCVFCDFLLKLEAKKGHIDIKCEEACPVARIFKACGEPNSHYFKIIGEYNNLHTTISENTDSKELDTLKQMVTQMRDIAKQMTPYERRKIRKMYESIFESIFEE